MKPQITQITQMGMTTSQVLALLEEIDDALANAQNSRLLYVVVDKMRERIRQVRQDLERTEIAELFAREAR